MASSFPLPGWVAAGPGPALVLVPGRGDRVEHVGLVPQEEPEEPANRLDPRKSRDVARVVEDRPPRGTLDVCGPRHRRLRPHVPHLGSRFQSTRSRRPSSPKYIRYGATLPNPSNTLRASWHWRLATTAIVVGRDVKWHAPPSSRRIGGVPDVALGSGRLDRSPARFPRVT